MKDFDYETKVQLRHNEVAAKLNVETGEIKVAGKPRGKASSNFQKFDLMSVYHRFNPAAWSLLESQTTKDELLCAVKLAQIAKAYTNSLVPLNDDTTLSELSYALGVNRNIVSKYVDKLFKLGVIGKFEVYKADEVHTKYWVFNPYLAFNGDKIRKDVVTLFEGTYYQRVSKK